MKAQVRLTALREAVGWAARALAARPATPVLASLRLEAGDGEITVAAFDYDTSASMTIPADVADPGAALMPGRLAAQLLPALTGDTTELSATDGTTVLACGRSTFTLRAVNIADYPGLPEDPPPAGRCEAEALAAAFASVLPAAGGKHDIAALQAVHLRASGLLRLETSNRYQAARIALDWTPSGAETDTLIPLPAAALIRHLEDEVTIGLPAGEVQSASFTGGGRRLVTRTIGDQFPNVARFFGQDRPTTVTTGTGDLLGALKATELLLDGPLEPVLVTASGGELSVSVPAGQAGDGTVMVDGAEVDGPDIAVYFQPARLAAAITAAGEKSVIKFGDNSRKAALVTGAEGSYQHVVMPVAR